jgi:hypothetical protein
MVILKCSVCDVPSTYETLEEDDKVTCLECWGIYD